EVALVLTVCVVDHDHDLSIADVGDRFLDPGEDRRRSFHLHLAHRLVSSTSARNNDSTYFAITSTSMFTGSPALAAPRVVTASVCGIRATENAPSSTLATVRLTPST